jgi:hypothetical protein
VCGAVLSRCTISQVQVCGAVLSRATGHSLEEWVGGDAAGDVLSRSTGHSLEEWVAKIALSFASPEKEKYFLFIYEMGKNS